MFRVSQWGHQARVSIAYVCYRIVVALYFTITYFILWGNDNTSPEKWLIYLTNQGLLLLLLHYLLDMVLTTGVFMQQRCGQTISTYGDMSVLEKTSWFLANASSSVALMITIFFWLFLYSDENSYSNTFLHLINSVSVLIDLAIIARPVRLLHMVHPLLFGLWYLSFSVVYWAAGGTDPEGHRWIYPMVDWGRPGMAVATSVGCMAGVAIIHSAIYGLTAIRGKIHQQFCKQEEEQMCLNVDF